MRHTVRENYITKTKRITKYEIENTEIGTHTLTHRHKEKPYKCENWGKMFGRNISLFLPNILPHNCPLGLKGHVCIHTHWCQTNERKSYP